MTRVELAVVMPVYNEAGAIESVVRVWVKVLDELGIDWLVHLYGDG